MVSQPTKVISPKMLAHVVLRTSPENFQAMVTFYTTFLGGTIRYQNANLAFLTYDEEHHRIAIAAIPGTKPKDRQSSGLEHIAFTFDSLKNLLLAYTQRKELGITPAWSVNHGTTLSMYYADPDGHYLETQVDSFGTADEATAFMESEAFDRNPFGVDFDPDEAIRKLESGVAESEILKMPNSGPRDISTVPIVQIE